MADVFLKRTLTGFAPADAPSEAQWRKYKVGEIYRAKVTKPRNYKHHCLFMCLLEKTYENQERYTNARQFRRAVAREAGHVEELITLDGEVLRIPLSYSYDEIPDEDDFTHAFGAAMTVCASILRVTAPDLEEEISRYANENYGIECPRIFRAERKIAC
jgi:hypothetical protein